MTGKTMGEALGSFRVGANAALAGASIYAAVAPLGAAPGAVVVGRGLLLAGAIALRAAAGAGRTPGAVAVAGVGLDAASVVLGAWRALTVPAAAAAVGLATAEVALAAGVLALAAAHLAVRAPLERRALRDVRAHRARIAARRKWLARARRAHQETQAQAELLTQLVVHDLRSPLTVILASLRAVQAAIGGLSGLEEEVESLEVASGEAARLSRMIGDLLLVPRLERGELRGQFCAVAIRNVLDASTRANHLLASAKAVRVEVAASPTLVAWIDADLVRRMVENLLSNALRYTPSGGRIELAAGVDGERLRVAVRNSGAPIPDVVRARLFEKYATHGPGRQNNGLGLFLCRLVAEVHGGRIALVERSGWGASFEAELPLAGRGGRTSTSGGQGMAASGRPT